MPTKSVPFLDDYTLEFETPHDYSGNQFLLGLNENRDDSYRIRVIDDDGRSVSLSEIRITFNFTGPPNNIGDDRFKISDIQALRAGSPETEYNGIENIYFTNLIKGSETVVATVPVDSDGIENPNFRVTTDDVSLTSINPVRILNTGDTFATLVLSGTRLEEIEFNYQSGGTFSSSELPSDRDFTAWITSVSARTAPVVRLDFDTPINYNLLFEGGRSLDLIEAETGLPIFREDEASNAPLANFSAAQRQSVLQLVQKIYDDSGIPIHFSLDETEQRPHTVVRFSGAVIEGGGLAPGRLHGIAPLDRFDNSKSDFADIFGLRNQSTEQVAFTVAHEVAHTFGAAHHQGDRGNAPSFVMLPGISSDHNTTDAQFSRGPILLAEEFSIQNPSYHIKRYAVEETNESLVRQGLTPGPYDLDEVMTPGVQSDELSFSFLINLNPGLTVSDVSSFVKREIGFLKSELVDSVSGSQIFDLTDFFGEEVIWAGVLGEGVDYDVFFLFDAESENTEGVSGKIVHRIEEGGELLQADIGTFQLSFTPTDIDEDGDPDEADADGTSDGSVLVPNPGEDTGDDSAIEAVDDSAFTFVGRRVMIDPLSNDTDATESSSIQSVEDPLNGQVYISEDRSVVIYEPDPLFAGTDSFRYTISQGAGDAQTALVTVDVGNWNHVGAVTLSTDRLTDRTTQYNLRELGLTSGLVGDVNGDANDDRVVHEENTTGVNFSEPFYEFQDTYTGTNGFEFLGENGTVRRVGSAGDFNGDGIDDLAVWWSGFDPGPPFTTSESVFVIYGKSGSFDGTVNLDSLGSEDGIEVTGLRNTVEALDLDVYPITGGGDFNNDGFDDLVIGSPGSAFSIDSFGSGLTFVLLGSDAAKSGSTFNLFSSGDLVLIDGGVAGVTSGLGVDWLGDLNSDGFDDLGILQLSSGVVGDIVFGESLAESNIVTLGDGSESLRVEGARGTFLNAAQDVNGDLLADFVLGVADGLDDEVYLVLGHEGVRTGILDLSGLALGDNAFKFVGHTDGVRPLFARGVDDLDGDGFNDLAITTRTIGGTNVDIVFGGFDNLKRLDLSDGLEDGIIEVGEEFDRLAPEPDEAEKNVLIGEAASDVLVGGDGADVIVSGAGTYDKMSGGGFADQFVFGSEAENGIRERSVILDYEVGIDEIVLIEGASAASVRETSSQVVIFLEGDRDAIYVRGDGVTADNITIVTDDVFEFI